MSRTLRLLLFWFINTTLFRFRFFFWQAIFHDHICNSICLFHRSTCSLSCPRVECLEIWLDVLQGGIQVKFCSSQVASQTSKAASRYTGWLVGVHFTPRIGFALYSFRYRNSTHYHPCSLRYGCPCIVMNFSLCVVKYFSLWTFNEMSHVPMDSGIPVQLAADTRCGFQWQKTTPSTSIISHAFTDTQAVSDPPVSPSRHWSLSILVLCHPHPSTQLEKHSALSYLQIFFFPHCWDIIHNSSLYMLILLSGPPSTVFYFPHMQLQPCSQYGEHEHIGISKDKHESYLWCLNE